MPKAAIVISVYNGREHLHRCISSVMNQTLQDFECIIVDDGSTDGSDEAAINEITGDRRFLLYRQEHQGLSAARNAGTNLADADVIFHLDADDIALPEMMEKATKFLLDNNLDMAFFNASVEDGGAADCHIHREEQYFQRKKDYGIGKGKDILKEMVGNGDYVYAAFIQATRKSRICKTFYPGLRAQDKLYTTQNLWLMNRVGHLPEILYVKKCHPKCITYSRHDAHYAWSRMKTGLELMKLAEKTPDSELIFRMASREISSVPRILSELKKSEMKWIASLPQPDRAWMEAFEKMSIPMRIL